jgi:3-hydroxy-9,10-secoandrosta-1,3,5(10)-triene-9,17-dione monooxygenase reductase component
MRRALRPATFRFVLGHFCSGVTVVTGAGPLGFTCQAFCSLSIDPPLVLFTAGRSSTTWPRIRELGAFCVNVLAEGCEKLSVGMSQSGTDKFAGVAWTPSRNGAPRLDGALAWIDCRLHTEHDGGDHTIVVAEVDDLGVVADAPPLLFFKGRYQRMNPSAAQGLRG